MIEAIPPLRPIQAGLFSRHYTCSRCELPVYGIPFGERFEELCTSCWFEKSELLELVNDTLAALPEFDDWMCISELERLIYIAWLDDLNELQRELEEFRDVSRERW